MLNLEYLTNQNGQPIAVVIPIELWQKILPSDDFSLETITDAVEDYCLNKAMDEAQSSQLYSRAEALAFLED